MPAAALLVATKQLDDLYAMHTHLPERATVRGTVAALATAAALVAAAPAGAQQPTPVTVTFDAITTVRNWHGGQALGTFTMAGARGDAGSARVAYRTFGGHIQATATLIGANGIWTIGLRATIAQVLDDHQTAIGRWRACGGTGTYRRLVGHGDWTGIVDVVPTPTGDLPRALRGTYVGPVHRSSALGGASSFGTRDPHC
jgi:hypothetical protein